MRERMIILSADSACDLSKTFSENYKINYCPFHIHLHGKQYKDGVDIFPDDIYKMYYEKKILPKTSAVNVQDYKVYFKGLQKEGYDILHVNLSSGLSSTYQNCVIVAKEMRNIYPVDSCNLSTGIGVLVIKAAKMIKEGFDAIYIQKELSLMTAKLKSSFVVDTLEFLKAGGRCSAIVSVGASLFSIKPCIEVNNEGKLVLGKKYRGSLDQVLLKYTDNILENIETIEKEQIFITHSGIAKDYIDMVYKKIEKINYFENIYIQRAGCTISSHCGPNTLGLIYLSK
jgi:DegV family protein with EDD domain